MLVSITLCTDDEAIERAYRTMEVYRDSGVDVCMDYRGEMIEIKRLRSSRYRFSFGDYVVKVIIGNIDPEIHRIDLPPPGCCQIM